MNPQEMRQIEGCHLDMLGIDIGLFESYLGNYAVVMREQDRIKGILCISLEQACEIYSGCLEKIRVRYLLN
jgi:hypothetical protein